MKTLVQEITEIIELEYYNQMTTEQAVNLILQAISKRDKECLKKTNFPKTSLGRYIKGVISSRLAKSLEEI